MVKAFTPSAILLKGLEDDIFWLLSLVYARRKRAALPELSTMSREAFVLELLLLESATRDIVSRLYALDDKGDNVRSFQTAFAAMNREGLDPRRTKTLDVSVKAFRQSLSDLKINHRNSYIGHVKELVDVAPRIIDAPVAFEDSVSRAVRLLDEIRGAPVSYRLKIGSQEAVIDLRIALSGVSPGD